MAGYIGSKAVNLSTTGADINGDANIDGDLSFRDNDKVIFGAGSDLQIYHDGSNSYITDEGTGSLLVGAENFYLRSPVGAAEEYMIRAIKDAQVDLYYNNSLKLATTSTGVDITGTLTSDGVTLATGSVINFTERGNLTHNASNYDMTFNTNSLANALVIKGTGQVGIGTSSPSSFWSGGNQLVVGSGTGSQGLTIYSGTTSDAGIYFSDGTVGNALYQGQIFYRHTDDAMVFDTAATERMRIDSSGRVGIGDVPKASFTGHSILQIGGQAILGANDALSSTGQTYLSHNIYFDTSGNAQVFNTSSANEGAIYQQADGVHKWSNSAATTGTPSVQERMRIDSSGNVGIGDGTLSHTSMLHIYKSGATADLALQSAGASGRKHILQSKTDGSLAFYDNNASSERMRIDSSGNLLVGRTSTINGGTNTTGGAQIGANGLIQAAVSGDTAIALQRLTSDGDIIQFRKDNTTVGSIGVASGVPYFDNPTGSGLEFGGGRIYPRSSGAASDNTKDFGDPVYRWDDIYATNGTIQTSDRNEKQDIAELSDAEQRVAVAAKGLLRKFRWRDAVEAKGDEARTHFGIIAQDLQAAFAAEGLDAGDYAMFISSTWTDEETGEERTRMGVRYSELLAFIIGAL